MSNEQAHRDELDATDPLAINKETVQDLEVSAEDQEAVKGGQISRPPISWSCPQPRVIGAVNPAATGPTG